MTLITDLAHATDPRSVGGKAANLNRLIRAGFHVPPGIVLTTAAFDTIAGRIPTRQRYDVVRALTDEFPDDLRRNVLDAVAAMPTPLVVRSSAVGEDGRSRSHAGQYHSVVNVAPTEIVAGIVQCWASAYSRSAASYRGEAGIPAMSVLIQPMVNPKFSGVMFTVDPVCGDPSQVAVEAVAGDPTALCDGRAEPHSFAVDKVTFDIRRRIDDGTAAVPTDALIAQVAATGMAIQREFNAPQDIEWAAIDGDVTILQSRPVTVDNGRQRTSLGDTGKGFIDTAVIFGTD